MVSFTLNNRQVSVDADPKTPLLWAIRDVVGLTGTKYGCGAIGASRPHRRFAQRSCMTDVGSSLARKSSPSRGCRRIPRIRCRRPDRRGSALCGYCQSGQIMKAAELLAKNPKPSRTDIITMDGNICRCGPITASSLPSNAHGEGWP